MKNWLLFICLLATLQLATNQISSPVQLTHSFETRPLDAGLVVEGVIQVDLSERHFEGLVVEDVPHVDLSERHLEDFSSPMNYDSVVKDSFDYGYERELVFVNPAGERFGIRSGLGIANVNPAGRGFEQDFPSPINFDSVVKDSFDYVTRPELEPRPVDCCDIKRNSNTTLASRVYTIYPPTAENNAVEVYCDMDTEGGGWTVFLSRELQTNEVNFTGDWKQYRDGFGTPGKEYWLGNENLHALTQSRQRKNVLRLEYSDNLISNQKPESVWGEWDTFSVASNADKYQLTVMDPKPDNTASNETIDYHNGMLFTTHDENNDNETNRNCADLYKGGWWYNNCYKINPTGRHYYEDKTGIRVDKWSKEFPIPGYAQRLQLKMRLPVCGN